MRTLLWIAVQWKINVYSKKCKRNAARIITGATKVCSIQNLYTEKGWDTLQSYRNKHKLCQLFKIINGLTPHYLQNIFPPRVHELTRYRLRNNEDFAIPVLRTAAYYNSFFPSTKRLERPRTRCSKLSKHIQRYINNNRAERTGTPKFFDNVQTRREGQISHTRFRPECSSLNQHLYNSNNNNNKKNSV